MREGAQSPGDLFVQLSNAKDFRRALQTGVRLFADDAESKEYLARLAVHAKDWAVAEQAVADSWSPTKSRAFVFYPRPFTFLEESRHQGRLAGFEKLSGCGCPGGNTGCSEEIIDFRLSALC